MKTVFAVEYLIWHPRINVYGVICSSRKAAETLVQAILRRFPDLQEGGFHVTEVEVDVFRWKSTAIRVEVDDDNGSNG